MSDDDLPPGLEAARLLALGSGRTLVHVTGGEGRAEAVARLLRALAPELSVAAFPPWDCLPFDWASPSAEAMGRRMAVLRRLGHPEAAPQVVVTSPAALLQRVPPPGAARARALRRGEPLDADALRAFLRGAGYRLDERVDEPGEAAFRAEVVDLFPAAEGAPVRLEVRDGRIAAIRRYDPATQISTGETDALVIDAASELPGAEGGDEERPRGAEHWLPEAYEALATLLDHAPGARLSATAAALRGAEAMLAQVAEAHADRRRHGDARGEGRRPLAPERLYLTAAEWRDVARGARPLAEDGWAALPAFAQGARPRAALREFVTAQAGAGRRLVLVGAGPRDGGRLGRAAGRAATPAASWAEAAGAEEGAVLSLDAPLDRGFVDEGAGLAVVAARDVLGSRAGGGPEGEAVVLPWQVEATELALGDAVIHEDHGAALLDGLEEVGPEGEGEGEEAIRLAFAEGEVLLVPVNDAGKLWRYGSAEAGISLDRLRGDGWAKRRAKAAAGIAQSARLLVAAAAERDARKAPRLVPDAAPFERLVARFPFEETPDQRRAVAAVLADLAAGRPMNRLLVGDVGFGKTEVALRAAAAAALAGRQVAVVAPTTVLARQHAATFARRFEGLGVEVAHYSRLVPPKEARGVREGLADGRVRVVVGTHALLGKGVAFADLGLVVIDEEQRFGAAHKAKLRALAADAHLLAMSATPIPRTLQAALVGLQDLSVLSTPPTRRRPIRTSVAPDDDTTLRQALARERRRGGQSFVVVPRVEDMEPAAERLRRLLPGLDVRSAHGQMPAAAIDAAMVGFAEGRGDVLLATSLIESGLDVPRANTMVVLRPELFGLAQLHQLRGRVGRGGLQAYCYLVPASDADLGDATLRRLGTLQAQDRLGAGMAISAQDLDLRGGGELFGERQSGHVRLIGLALYQELLAAALREARGEDADMNLVELQADHAGRLPPDYIPEPEGRINLYHRLARTREAGDVDRLEAEVADRYGPLPPPAQALVTAARLRALARPLGVVRVSAGPQAVALAFADGVPVAERHADAVARGEGALQWDGERLVLHRPSTDAEERTGIVLDLLEDLAA